MAGFVCGGWARAVLDAPEKSAAAAKMAITEARFFDRVRERLVFATRAQTW